MVKIGVGILILGMGIIVVGGIVYGLIALVKETIARFKEGMPVIWAVLYGLLYLMLTGCCLIIIGTVTGNAGYIQMWRPSCAVETIDFKYIKGLKINSNNNLEFYDKRTETNREFSGTYDAVWKDGETLP